MPLLWTNTALASNPTCGVEMQRLSRMPKMIQNMLPVVHQPMEIFQIDRRRM
jgi:hypothetical protein